MPPPSTPRMCTQEMLVDGVPAVVGGPMRGGGLLLGASPTTAISSADVYQSTGLEVLRNLTALYAARQQTSGDVRLYIQGVQYLSQQQLVAKRNPESIMAVLRTPNTWVDRVKVRVSYQVKDAYGSAVVKRPSRVMMQLGAPTASLSARTVACSTGNTQHGHHVDYCSATHLPMEWFGGIQRSSTVTVSLYDSTHSGVVQVKVSVHVGVLTLNALPSWWDAALQSSTVGSGLTAPTWVPSTGGIFVSLPTSPVYAGESFRVYMYAHTAGLSLSAWRVRLYFSRSLLAYASFSQNGHFNSASSSMLPGEVSWLATGIKSTTSNSDVRGTAIYLLSASLSFLSSVTAGSYGGTALGLYPRATELISGAVFVQDSNGQVFDGRDGVQTAGELVVAESPSAVAIFASAPGGVLANLAPLTGSESTYTLAVAQVSDDDRTDLAISDVSSGTSCSTSADRKVLVLSGCSVVLGASQSKSQSSVLVSVSYGRLGAAVSLDVYAPQVTSISLSDSTLNRFADSSGSEISGCSSGSSSAHPYQRAQAVAYADGLDATSFVSFFVANSKVAGVSSSRFDVIQGKQAGSTYVHLGGRLGLQPSVSLTVSDTLVTATSLIARVVTGASWTSVGQPPPQYSFGDVVTAHAVLSNSMSAEGDSGLMFSRVVWSDGSTEDVGYAPAAGIESMHVTTSSSSISTAEPTGSDSFWRLGVAVGAVKECSSSAVATWKVCGLDVIDGNVPLFLDLPDPLSASVATRESRLTAPTSDARLVPISVPMSSRLTVRVAFSDGSERDLSTDSRVSYSTVSAACATVASGAGSNTIRIASLATCTSVVVVASVQLGPYTFVVNTTTPVVHISSMEVSFSGYPDTSHNRGRAVTTLGLVPCLSSVYFHATATAHVSLSDGSSIDVARQSSLATSSSDVVYLSSSSSTRMQARSAGTATISAQFGSQTTASAALEVQDSVLDSPTALAWSVPALDANNLMLAQSVTTQVSLTYQSGLMHANLAGGAYDSWVDVASLIYFSSSQASAMQLSTEGRVSLLDNYHASIDLGASVSCMAGVGFAMSRFANLKAAPMDVDFGSLRLAIPVHRGCRPPGSGSARAAGRGHETQGVPDQAGPFAKHAAQLGVGCIVDGWRLFLGHRDAVRQPEHGSSAQCIGHSVVGELADHAGHCAAERGGLGCCSH